MRVRLANGQEVYQKAMRRRERADYRLLTFSCFRKLPLFRNDRIKEAFRDHLGRVMAELPAELVAWVVMPDHVHILVWSDPETCTMRRLTHALKTPFSRRVIGRWRELEAPVLAHLVDGQGRTRFWEHGGGHDRNLLRRGELDRKIAYVHENPVRAGLCTEPSDWPWSSARWCAGMECAGDVEIPRVVRRGREMGERRREGERVAWAARERAAEQGGVGRSHE